MGSSCEMIWRSMGRRYIYRHGHRALTLRFVLPFAIRLPASAASLDRVGSGNGDEAESDDTDAVKYSLVVATAAGTADAGVVFSPQPVIEFVKRNGRVGNADQDVTASLIGGPGRLLGLTTVQTRTGIA